MISRNKKIAIVGLGLLGASYAKALRNAGYYITGIDIDPEAIAFARNIGWINEGGEDPALVSNSDIVISALYPHTFIAWIRENQKYLKENAILSDVTGVKREIIKEVNKVLRKDVEFIACHPMAGREYKGIFYADSSLFEAANFIVVRTPENSEEAVSFAYDLANVLHFKHISELSPEEHDEMIGFLSQLTHVIAVSLMNVRDNSSLSRYTGDSFRDLTRIANINEDLWPELFVMNKDNLIREIDEFTAEMNRFRDLIEKEDYAGMKEKLVLSTQRRKAFDK